MTEENKVENEDVQNNEQNSEKSTEEETITAEKVAGVSSNA